MSTYSINDGTSIEAINLGNINDSLTGLIDNTSKLISPHDVRNAIYTSWESNMFKQTVIGTYSYIGIENTNIKEKILIGKRELSGSDILSTTLLDSDTDIFFYNTKTDTDSLQSTKLSFIGGTVSSDFINAPYIKAYGVFSTSSTSWIDLDISNASGSINIDANNVSIKGINYPSSASASNDLFLKYSNGTAIWDTPSVTSMVSSGTVSITGSPVLVNGYPLEYSNSFPTQVTIGGITEGSTFSNVPLTELVTQLLYPYLVPQITLTTNSLFYEYGNTYTPTITWNIKKRSNTVVSGSVTNVISNIPGATFPILSGTASGTLTSINFQSFFSASWVFTSVDSNGSTASTTLTSTGVYPFFYGMTASTPLTGVSHYSGLNKYVKGKSDIIVNYTGNVEYMYFSYPDDYGLLTDILDQNNFSVINSFTYSIANVDSTGIPVLWSKSYYIYKTTLLTSNYGYNFQFKF